jgi:hypothetical protein
MVYKYGCSDARFNHLGGTPFLFWNAIQDAKGRGLEKLDLGRSDIDNPGLVAFKERLGAVNIPLNYWSYPAGQRSHFGYGHRYTFGSHLIPMTPVSLLKVLGRIYRHLG